MIKILTNSKLIIKSIKSKATIIDKKSDIAIQKITAKISTHIKERTLSGKDKNKKRFKKYSKRTIEIKKKTGGKFFTGKVNLSQSGKMMSALQGKRVSSKIGIVGFVRKEEAKKAADNINGSKFKNRPKREFFGLSKSETNRFIKDFKNMVKL